LIYSAKLACRGEDNYFYITFNPEPNPYLDPMLFLDPAPALKTQIISYPNGSGFGSITLKESCTVQ
jgi:hypothetical protein